MPQPSQPLPRSTRTLVAALLLTGGLTALGGGEPGRRRHPRGPGAHHRRLRPDRRHDRDDRLYGRARGDNLIGDAGDDYLSSNEGVDVLGRDTDTNAVDSGDDPMAGCPSGNVGLDTNENTAYCDARNDEIRGVKGPEHLSGGLGNNILRGAGGDGADSFIPNSADATCETTVGTP